MGRTLRLIARMLAIWLVGAAAPAVARPFTVVVLPDTQGYTWRDGKTFAAQTDWIVRNREPENIVFVTHLGDITDAGYDSVQWDKAVATTRPDAVARLPGASRIGSADPAVETEQLPSNPEPQPDSPQAIAKDAALPRKDRLIVRGRRKA
jgi:hypothetical protein